MNSPNPKAHIASEYDEKCGTDQIPTTVNKKTREEILKDSISPVKNVKTSKQYLENKCLVISGEPYTVSSLSSALLHLSQSSRVLKAAIDGMRAIAILMEEISVVEEIMRCEEKMERIMVTMEKKCIALVDDVVGAMERMMEDTKKEMMEMKNLSSQMPPSSGAKLTQPSYAGVLAPNPTQPRSTPPTVQQTLQSALENTLAKEEVKSKQVLLTSDREFPACPETELVEHTNTAILEMGEDYAGYEAVGLKKL
ncbi:hypothetical protein M422DRAFT_266634 [Sphaerobolus stellatus SS14]|uniref:Uncharacterized protein n=1 Tax=Sphaerobolus stellatus (strain SS14) TaxID=990650 RepID=A0A0C9UAP0_SPHS4|nr:hypothetical protein M422DRAFT_266634 [Sphaerobolus stellatus SS14]